MYRFRLVETGEIVEHDWNFAELMEHQVYGTLFNLPEGEARRLVADEIPEQVAERSERVGELAYNRPWESMALGCHPSDIQKFRDDARKHGFTGVDFYVPCDTRLSAKHPGETMARCVITDKRQRERYIRHRQAMDRGGDGGNVLSAESLAAAERLTKERYGEAKVLCE